MKLVHSIVLPKPLEHYGDDIYLYNKGLRKPFRFLGYKNFDLPRLEDKKVPKLKLVKEIVND